jgi:MFS family permease
MVNELVLPRMRGAASAFYILMMTFVGLALGPFLMGWTSDRLARGGLEASEALRSAMTLGLLAYGLAVVFLWLASRSVEDEENARIERAKAAGEPI